LAREALRRLKHRRSPKSNDPNIPIQYHLTSSAFHSSLINHTSSSVQIYSPSIDASIIMTALDGATLFDCGSISKFVRWIEEDSPDFESFRMRSFGM